MQVLITGGSGFFGRAMSRILLGKVEVSRVCIYSRGEYAQACMKQETADPDGKLRFFIGDVRDQERLRRAMVLMVVHTRSVAWSMVIQKRVQSGSVTGTLIWPSPRSSASMIIWRHFGITDPVLPLTLPYRTAEKIGPFLPRVWLAASTMVSASALLWP